MTLSRSVAPIPVRFVHRPPSPNTSPPLLSYSTPHFHFFHPSSQTLASLPTPNPPTVPTHSVNGRAYSIGTPPPLSGILHVPVFIIALLNNFPPSPTPVLNSSFAAAMV